MSATIEKRARQSRKQWLEERQTYIGASEVAAVLGISPYDSPHDVWLAKTQGVQKDETLPMRRGRHMEPFIGREFTRVTGIKRRRGGFCRHAKWPFMACNLDYELPMAGEWYPLECKDVGYWPGQQWGNEGADQVPEHYLVQLAYQMIVTGKKLACLCALIDGRELKPYWYSFDPDLYDKAHILPLELARSITHKVCSFWEFNVVGRREPQLSHTESDYQFVKHERATYENGLLTNVDEEHDAEVVALAEELPQLESLKEKVEARKNRLKLFMARAGASELETRFGNFTYRTNAKGTATFNTPFRSGRA